MADNTRTTSAWLDSSKTTKKDMKSVIEQLENKLELANEAKRVLQQQCVDLQQQQQPADEPANMRDQINELQQENERLQATITRLQSAGIRVTYNDVADLFIDTLNSSRAQNKKKNEKAAKKASTKNVTGIRSDKVVLACRACMSSDDLTLGETPDRDTFDILSASSSPFVVSAKNHIQKHCSSVNCKWRKQFKDAADAWLGSSMKFISQLHFVELQFPDLHFSSGELSGQYSRIANCWHPFKNDEDGRLFRSMLKSFCLYMPPLGIDVLSDDEDAWTDTDVATKWDSTGGVLKSSRQKTYNYAYDTMYSLWFDALPEVDKNLVGTAQAFDA